MEEPKNEISNLFDGDARVKYNEEIGHNVGEEDDGHGFLPTVNLGYKA